MRVQTLLAMLSAIGVALGSPLQNRDLEKRTGPAFVACDAACILFCIANPEIGPICYPACGIACGGLDGDGGEISGLPSTGDASGFSTVNGTLVGPNGKEVYTLPSSSK